MAKEILDIVKKMLDSSDMKKQKALVDLLNSKMPKGGSVVEHVLKPVKYT